LGGDASGPSVGQECPSGKVERDDAAYADKHQHDEDDAEEVGVDAEVLRETTGDATDEPLVAADHAAATDRVEEPVEAGAGPAGRCCHAISFPVSVRRRNWVLPWSFPGSTPTKGCEDQGRAPGLRDRDARGAAKREVSTGC